MPGSCAVCDAAHERDSPYCSSPCYHRARRDRLRDAGVCTDCGTAAVKPGRVRCPACLEKQAAGSVAWFEKNLAEGRCRQCGGEKLPGQRHCQECGDTLASYNRAHRARRKERGDCTRCGNPYCWGCSGESEQY